MAGEVKELATLDGGFRRRTVFESGGSSVPKVDQQSCRRYVRVLTYHIV